MLLCSGYFLEEYVRDVNSKNRHHFQSIQNRLRSCFEYTSRKSQRDQEEKEAKPSRRTEESHKACNRTAKIRSRLWYFLITKYHKNARKMEQAAAESALTKTQFETHQQWWKRNRPPQSPCIQIWFVSTAKIRRCPYHNCQRNKPPTESRNEAGDRLKLGVLDIENCWRSEKDRVDWSTDTILRCKQTIQEQRTQLLWIWGLYNQKKIIRVH